MRRRKDALFSLRHAFFSPWNASHRRTIAFFLLKHAIFSLKDARFSLRSASHRPKGAFFRLKSASS